VQFAQHSRRFEAVMQDLFAGTQPYLGLPRRLWRGFAPTLLEMVSNRRPADGKPAGRIHPAPP
jgi:hypothetical protein